ncbi:cytochrome c-type biogenesis protein [Chitinibacter sp. GC72]|uniref:cytochrome c-type biogenesis protein n=1 Tax=Chitinibacter sp. GC72 TaxID=1526917 RepID=UPI001E2A57F3|nr:cytochrome c-type biogenesis protein [Chitinibacter sp. GC72]
MLMKFAMRLATLWLLSAALVSPSQAGISADSSAASNSISSAASSAISSDVAVEERLVVLSSELRCLVCQNESLASSRAPLAEDLRREVREQIRAGRSDAQIIDYLTARYGDFVTYRPPWRGRTLLLWLGPFCLLILAMGMFMYGISRKRQQHIPADVSPLGRSSDQASNPLSDRVSNQEALASLQREFAEKSHE